MYKTIRKIQTIFLCLRSSVLIAQITEQIGERFDSPGSDSNGQLPVLNTDQVTKLLHSILEQLLINNFTFPMEKMSKDLTNDITKNEILVDFLMRNSVCPGGCLPWGGVCLGGCLPRGVCLPGGCLPRWGVSAWWG